MIESILTKTVLLIDKTLRKKYLNDTPRYSHPAIYPFWHGNEFAMLMSNQNNNIVIMVSLSKDGELLSQLLNNLGYITVRGSSSKGAQRALIEIIRYGRKNYSLAFAADGPRGPYHKLKAGVIYAAQKSGLPIIPICCSSKRNFILKKTWDKERIPKPFSKTVQIWGHPIYVSEQDNIEEKTLIVENEVNKLFDLADNYYWKKDIVKYIELHPAPKILIVQPSRLGDIVFTLPTLVSIKKKYPNARISWLVDERCAEILKGNPYLENIFIWDRKKRSPSYYAKLKKELRSQNFDLSVDFHGLAKSAFLVLLAGAKFKIASSSTNGMRELSWLISKEIKSPYGLHCIERNLQIAKYLGAPYYYAVPLINVSGDEKNSCSKILIENGADLSKPILCLHIGGGWTSRRWAVENFALLIDKANAAFDINIILIGGKEGGKSEKGLNEDLRSLAKTKFLDLTDKFTLKQTCALFLKTKVFVAGDSGPMHIASAALNIATIGLLGPTNAQKTRPYGSNSITIQHKFDCQLDYYPCVKRDCPNPICMKSITVEEVFDAVASKLK